MKKLTQLYLLLFFNFLFAQNQEYTVKNTSVNSKYAELGVIYLQNGQVLFASSQKDENDKAFSTNRRKQNSQLFLDLYKATVTRNGDLILNEKFTNDVNNQFFESDLTFTPDFKTVYFTWNNYYNTESRKDSAKWKTQHIVKASIDKNLQLSNITSLPFNNDEYSIKNPHISPDGTQLFFTSDMPGGFGETDIYVVTINADGTYGIPENLGETVNTKNTEMFPYLDVNNTLYFTSNGYKNAQNFDIYSSKFENNIFLNAERLPAPINSKFDDLAFVINKEANAGFFTSNRDEGNGDVDIYSFTIKDVNLICEQTIKGLFINEKTGEYLDNVKISIFENNQLLDSQLIPLGNPYIFKLECNSSYKFIAELENYKTNEFELKTGATSTNLDKNIKLAPIECNQTITGLIFDKITKVLINNPTVQLFNNNQLIDSKNIPTGTRYNFKLNCKETYTIKISKEGYVPFEETFTTLNINTDILKDIHLAPIECDNNISGMVFNTVTNKPLTNVKVTVYANNNLVNSQIFNPENRFNFKLNCNENYKIIAEKDGFEPYEENFKTTISTSNFIKDIKLTPIECKGLISGLFFDKSTGRQIDNVNISLFADSKFVETKNIKVGYKYNFNLNCDKTYTLKIEKEGYNSVEETINTPPTNTFEITKNISLVPEKCTQLLDATIVSAETNLPLKNAIIFVYKSNDLIETINLDEKTNFTYEVDCNSSYRIVASLKNYTNDIEVISTSTIKNQQLFKKFKLEKNIEFIAVNNQKMIKTKPIYFDLDKDDIRPDAAIELTKVIDILNKYPAIKLEIKSHTDSRAPDNYNFELSNRRAKSVISYIISKGIDPNRISGKGYGETQLINKCSNGVKCTEAEHELNRRTDFIVIE